MKNEYDSSYSSLKTKLNIPNGIDFSFSLDFPTYSIIAERDKPLRAEIFSETKLKEVLKTNGAFEFAYITSKIW